MILNSKVETTLKNKQCYLRDEYREVSILDSKLAELVGEEVADPVPYAVRPRTEDVATRDVVVVNHLSCHITKYKNYKYILYIIIYY